MVLLAKVSSHQISSLLDVITILNRHSFVTEADSLFSLPKSVLSCEGQRARIAITGAYKSEENLGNQALSKAKIAESGYAGELVRNREHWLNYR